MITLRFVGYLFVTGGLALFVQAVAVLVRASEGTRVASLLAAGLVGAWLLVADPARTVADRAGDEDGGPERPPQVRGSRPVRRPPHGW